MTDGIFLLMGGNLGNRLSFLQRACEELESNEILILHRSFIYESEAWPDPNEPFYLNQVLKIDGVRDPCTLLNVCQKCEESLGRTRSKRFGNRTIDIDILLFQNQVIQLPTLEVPHPRMLDRLFALLPLSDIAPDLVHPISGKTIREHIAMLSDTAAPKRFDLSS
jgi:2-amino-4-hydroxy-6-hydroxymethyldihydropteridine diphosphokinase